MESCKGCPSFVEAEQTLEIFGRNVGQPMCKRFGFLLGRPGLNDRETDTLQEYMAMTCGEFGKKSPSEKPDNIQSKFFEPNPEQTFVDVVDKSGPSKLNSCRNCVHCAQAAAVRREVGFGFDACHAKGKLILNVRSECKECPFALQGGQSDSMRDFNYLPHFDSNFSIPSDQVIERLVGSGATVEPSEYESDRPVSAADTEAGIRAWRRITDPDGSGNEAWLPVMAADAFSDEEKKLIPKMGDPTHPETYVDYGGLTYAFAAEAHELQETLALQGAPGLGKTEFARHMAYIMQVPFRRFSFTSASEVDDMIGKMMYEPERGTYFHKGRLVDAYSRPGVMVLDELNLAEPALREALRPLFDNNKQLVLDAGMGEMVDRHDLCFLVIAQNPSWDIRNTGAREGDDADYNRLAVIEIEYPPEPVERHIIIERCKLDGYKIPDHLVDAIVRIAFDIRQLAEQDVIPFTWGIRQQIKVARKTQYYGLLTAYRRSALDFYEPEVREQIVRIVKDFSG